MFTDRELEFIFSLRTSWPRLYSAELARLLKESFHSESQAELRSMEKEASTKAVMPKLFPNIHVLAAVRQERREWSERARP